jgi:hypothetical protein
MYIVKATQEEESTAPSFSYCYSTSEVWRWAIQLPLAAAFSTKDIAYKGFVFVTAVEMFSAYTQTNSTKGSEVYVTNTILKSHLLDGQTNSGNTLTQFALLML